MSKCQPIVLFLAIICQFYSIDATLGVIVNQKDILDHIEADSFDRTAPNYPGDNLCKQNVDYKRIVCDGVMDSMSEFGQWGDSRTGSPRYRCHEAKILHSSKSVFVYECTDRPFYKTENPHHPDILGPPFADGILIGESQADPLRTYVYTRSTVNGNPVIVGVFELNDFNRDQYVDMTRVNDSFDDMDVEMG